MVPRNKLKILNDPIYGFITIPNELLFDIIEHKYFQRLRRITQMGLSYLVYPGAHHTRFHHALGCMFLIEKAIQVLRQKGIEISWQEQEAVEIAIVLHDIGHGPFSHAMENSIIEGISHETISRLFMEMLNKEFDNRLDLAIEIFTGKYPRKFLCQLISSQLDMDRLDYLKRDSFYTGVAEGNINSDRLISMLTVVNNELMVEAKGIYSVEKFLLARRLMYWQVYLHKTGVVAEQLLIRVLKRAKELAGSGRALFASSALNHFLYNRVSADDLNWETIDIFSRLDDYDIISAMKEWAGDEDFVLSNLCRMIINRDLLKIKLIDKPEKSADFKARLSKVADKLEITREEAKYFVFSGEISNTAYRSEEEEKIHILHKDGKITDVVKASDHFNLKALTKPVVKYYICYPKTID
ncbi:MAG TPA: HD domain-containing protein [Salinimicrobium sp.]|nr:HD domain-containing protein [Salinimicrobium sp.]